MRFSVKAIEQCRTIDRHGFRRQLSQAKSPSARDALVEKISASIQAVQKRRQLLPKIYYPEALPVTARADELVERIQQHQILIVAGETGSGKSTQIPKLCLAAGQGVYGQIAHTQPRRIATRAIANRLAQELVVQLGSGVGYRVRFDEKISQQDYIRVLTDGMLLAEAQRDRFLNQYDTIIVDEAHERSLNIDFLLGFLKQLLAKRKDLKLIITSATIDTDKFSKHFNDAPIVNVSGRTYPVEVRYQAPEDEKSRSDRQTNQAILDAIDSLFKKRPGHTLVFLPGEREIREAQKFLQRRLKPGIEVLPLYARLPAKDQVKLFRPAHATRIILSTNVAETSLTLPGIDYVIDTGLARVSRYSPGRRVNTLPIERISKAAADQRKGRCGRVKNGICVRLYSEEDFASREDYTAPEILRTALTGVVLALKFRRLGEPEAFPFIDPPERKQWNAARQELKILGALDDDQGLTPIGIALAKLNVDPRIGCMLYAAARDENCLAEMTILAASLEIPDPRLVPHDTMQAARQHHLEQAKGGCDFFALINLYQSFQAQRAALSRKQLSAWCQRNFLAPARMWEWRDLVRRLRQDASSLKGKINSQPADQDVVYRALLSGLLDQIAMKGEKNQYTGTYGKQLAIFPGSALAKNAPKWIMAAEMVETSQLFARTVAPVKVSWIEQLADNLIRHEYSAPYWSQKAGQVMAYQRGYFLNLPIFSGRRRPYGEIDPEEAHAIFIRDALVPGELNQPFDFVTHNLARIDEVVTLEHKIRRHDILVSDEVLVRFYGAQIPEWVNSEAGLKKWLRSLSTEQHNALFVRQETLLKREIQARDDLPDVLKTGKHKLALDYQFAPGEAHDGVSASVPLPLLNQLSQADFDRLVPGYLGEKIELLVRSLPKNIRKQLAPLAETIDHVKPIVREDTRPLLAALADALHAQSGLKVVPAHFNPATLPEHLNMKLVLLDEQGDELARADKLSDLQDEFGDQASNTIAETDHTWQQQGLTDWHFDDLPVNVVVNTHGLETQAYPALVDAGDTVNIQLFDDPIEAQYAHKMGVTRLARFGSRFGKSLVKRPLPYWQEISLRYSAIGSQDGLRAALLDALIQGLMFAAEPVIQTKQQFERALVYTEQHFSGEVEPVCQALQLALNAYGQCLGLIEGLSTPSQEDIQVQLNYLIYEDFLLEVPLETVLVYPVYFKALAARIERLRYDPQGDEKKLVLLEPYWSRYLQSWEAHPDNAALDHYRWMVEAYRVSLFAPKVKPPIPVSPKRLDQAWQAFEATR